MSSSSSSSSSSPLGWLNCVGVKENGGAAWGVCNFDEDTMAGAGNDNGPLSLGSCALSDPNEMICGGCDWSDFATFDRGRGLEAEARGTGSDISKSSTSGVS